MNFGQPSAPHPALLAFVADPNHAILLLLVGILFIYAEFNKPGTVILGCFGALLTMFSIYGLLHLPLSHQAIGLTGFGIALVALGCRFRLYELPSALGLVALTSGLWNLSQSPRVHPVVAIVSATIFTLITTWLVRIALLARQNKKRTSPSVTPHLSRVD
jgi:membrane-bound ClpP family serine protease